MTAKIILSNVDDLIRKYLNGQSEYSLSLEYGISRIPIRRILLENGVTIRGRSAAGLVRASQMTPAQRAAQVSAAHVAATGREKTFAEQCLTAQTRQERRTTISDHEISLQKMLMDRGVETVNQLAIGPYNCDLAASPVAVEVFGGHWHWSGDHLRRTPKRFRYILDAGWHILVIPVTNTSPLTTAVADYVAAYIQEARSNPTIMREYRVIWRAGEFVTAGSLDSDDISIEPPFTGRQNLTTGRYETITK